MQEIALVTMKDITKDRSMRYDEALDGQVKENQYINNHKHFSSLWHVLLDLLNIKMLYRYGDLLPKSMPDFSQLQVGLKQYQICMKNVTRYQKLESCRYFSNFARISKYLATYLIFKLFLSKYGLYWFCYE